MSLEMVNRPKKTDYETSLWPSLQPICGPHGASKNQPVVHVQKYHNQIRGVFEVCMALWGAANYSRCQQMCVWTAVTLGSF
ncbi:hypothetical protein L596_011985 [Steinernema carpocapsae]|uniref:Uncharacterized protein n=1 Tax=Steinernema carpocapsae TaxID=34508 RepID=A0A4U5NWJ3_STECR|nr:hypothetical protein L596_011985 [Steinernema carpocapsae]